MGTDEFNHSNQGNKLKELQIQVETCRKTNGTVGTEELAIK